MNTKRTLSGTILAATASAALLAAVPNVTGVTMSQASDRLVTITYTLSDAPAVITLDVQTNVTGDVWASIGGEAVWNAMGDVWKKVGDGLTAGNSASCTITWHPDHSWPDHKIEGNNTRAVVTAWALENTPDYMVVDLETMNTVRYYPGADFLPKKGFDQSGAAVTNNPDYKTSKLLMRKIMARGIEWTMGSTTEETKRTAINEATHKVTLANNYYIGVFEITQRQWQLVATNSGAVAERRVDGAMRPMEMVAYNEIRNSHCASSSGGVSAGVITADPSGDSFLGLLRLKSGIDFDLPSEAQWEFAARAGHGSGFWGDGSTVSNGDRDEGLDLLGRNKYNGGMMGSSTPPQNCGVTNATAIVGSYKPNDWGLYDMHGNVWEWCLDWYEDDISAYGGNVDISPSNPLCYRSGSSVPADTARVRRGGSWYFGAESCRSACRNSRVPTSRDSGIGLRVVCTAGLR